MFASVSALVDCLFQATGSQQDHCSEQVRVWLIAFSAVQRVGRVFDYLKVAPGMCVLAGLVVALGDCVMEIVIGRPAGDRCKESQCENDEPAGSCRFLGRGRCGAVHGYAQERRRLRESRFPKPRLCRGLIVNTRNEGSRYRVTQFVRRRSPCVGIYTVSVYRSKFYFVWSVCGDGRFEARL
jgi:hypothetical protein